MAGEFDWYEARKKGLGDDFLAEVRLVFRLMEENPLRSAQIYRNARRALVRRFPYKVFYVVEEDKIEVIGVIHVRRDAQFWQQRVPS